MEKWRNKLGLALLSLGLMALTPNFASAQSCGSSYGSSCGSSCDSCCDPCDWDPCSCGGFEVAADFLWWKPCLDDLDYGVIYHGTDTKTVKYKNICPDWEPGVRVMVALPDFYCGWELSGSWTYINADDSSTSKAGTNEYASSPLIHSGLLADLGSGDFFTSVKGSWDTTYHEWDLLVSYDLSCKKCHFFKPFFGVAGIVLDQELKVDASGTISGSTYDTTYNGIVKWDSDYWGVGFRAGTQYEYRFSDCLRFFTRASGTILAGEADNKNDQTAKETMNEETNSYKLKFKDDDDCLIVPGYHLAAGFIYDTCWCDWDFSFRLGYEFLNWHNIPNHRVFSADDKNAGVGHSSSPSTRTFGFHGLLAGLSIGF